MTDPLKEKIQEAKDYIQGKSGLKPTLAIILGSGLGRLAGQIENKEVIPYVQIPHFAVSTAPGHSGNLILGSFGGKNVVAMQGRFHFYEGHSLEVITFPVRVMKALGAEILIESNASGGINPRFKAGELMVIIDHINLTGTNPLIGPNDDSLGPRFPDMSEPYDKKLIKLTEKVALKEGIKIHFGVYAGVTGPCFETPAEYRFLGRIGADVVGMSTVPEVIVARHCNLRVLGISCVTDECIPDCLEPLDSQKVIEVAKKAESVLTRLIKPVVARL